MLITPCGYPRAPGRTPRRDWSLISESRNLEQTKKEGLALSGPRLHYRRIEARAVRVRTFPGGQVSEAISGREKPT